ncbi:MAG TPA: MFS transporter [Streptosporangiaceae bacterium]|nr:MFS transporter [Streptosporangiaceae bacterium]
MTTQSVAVRGPAGAQAGYPRRWLAAIVMIVGALMDMIDVTIVNVALPTIRRDLHASATQLEWVVSGYMLAFAAALIIAGNLGDLFGRKRVFLAGVVVFGLASLAAGLSGSGAELIAARVVQGTAAAAMAPQVLATFRVIFAGAERGKAFSIYGAMLGFASAVGLLLGGVLTEANLFGWSWRTVFFVNVPVAAAALITGARFVPETRDRAARRPDVPGAVLLAASLVAIVYPLLEGRTLGWPGWVWLVLAAGVAGLGVLGLVEARRGALPGGARRGGARQAPTPLLRAPLLRAPLLRAGLFRVPAFAAGLGVQVAFSAGMQGFFLAFALWLQAGEHFSPLKAGLTAVAFSVGSFIGAPVAVPLAQKYGRGVLALGGLLMVAGIAGEWLAASHVGVNGSPWPVVPGLVVAGAGLALLVIPLVNVVLAAVPAEVAGGASGLFGTAQQLGGALGVAVFGTVFFGYLTGHSFEAAIVHTAPYAMGAFALCAVLALLLPRTAVSEEALLES